MATLKRIKMYSRDMAINSDAISYLVWASMLEFFVVNHIPKHQGLLTSSSISTSGT